MSLLSGCQEGKATPKLMEVKCPRCGGIMEVFVRMGGAAGETGKIVSEEKCEECGFVAAEGTPVSEFGQA